MLDIMQLGTQNLKQNETNNRNGDRTSGGRAK